MPKPVSPLVVPDLVLVCDRREFELQVWEVTVRGEARTLELAEAYPIAIGMKGHRTESGLHQIVGKKKHPDWKMPNEKWVPRAEWGSIIDGKDPRNPIVSRWLLFDEDEGEGIHGTRNLDSLGTDASHGCIRMSVEDVEKLYPKVPIGTLLFID